MESKEYEQTLYTRIVLLEATLSHPLVPVRACAIECAFVLDSVLDHALAFKNLQGKAHRCMPVHRLVKVSEEEKSRTTCQPI